VKAAVLQEPFKPAVENIGDLRTGQPGDAVIRITIASICEPGRYPCQRRVPLAGESARTWVAGAGRGSAGA
jgi:hypothetical protein